MVPGGPAAQLPRRQRRLPGRQRALPRQFQGGKIDKTPHRAGLHCRQQFPQGSGLGIGAGIRAFPQAGGQHDHRFDAVGAQNGHDLRRRELPPADGALQLAVPQCAAGFRRQPADFVALSQKIFRCGFTRQIPRPCKQYPHPVCSFPLSGAAPCRKGIYTVASAG